MNANLHWNRSGSQLFTIYFNKKMLYKNVNIANRIPKWTVQRRLLKNIRTSPAHSQLLFKGLQCTLKVSITNLGIGF